MPRITHDVQRRIEAYARAKGALIGTTPNHNNVKERIFSELRELIENNQLTVARLTQKLKELSSEDRTQLFYRRRVNGVSVYSETAQLISELFRDLGFPISRQTLQSIVAGELSRDDSTLKDRLNQLPYQIWRDYPHVPNARRNLEHELKGRLDCTEGNPAGLNKPGYSDLSLAEAIRTSLGEIADDAFKNKLEEYLLKVYQEAPEFLPELVTELKRVFKGTDKNQTFLDAMVSIAVSEEPIAAPDATEEQEKARKAAIAIKEALLNADLDIARAIVSRTPEKLFELRPTFQAAIHRDLLYKARVQSDADAETAATAIQVKAEEQLKDAGKAEDEAEPDPRVGAWVRKFIEDREAVQAGGAETSAGHNVHGALINNIYASLGQARVAPLINREAALRRIATYLARDPDHYKKAFFVELSKNIRQEGFSLEVLNRALQGAEHARLFRKFGGRMHSQAAQCLFELYQLAMLEELSNDEKNAIVTSRTPPAIHEGLQSRQKSHIKQQIEGILNDPKKSKDTLLGQKIYAEVQRLKRCSQVFQREKAQDIAQAEATYQQYLLKKAMEAANDEEKRRFDPQGHVLVEVTLGNAQYEEILAQLRGQGIEVEAAFSEKTPKEQLESLLGLGTQKLTETTYCNLDIKGHPDLEEAFKAWAKAQVAVEGRAPVDQTQLNSAVDALMASPSRGSVIRLQEEMEMHMRLASRVLESLDTDDPKAISPEKWQTIRDKAAREINAEVRKAFQQALVESLNGGQPNIALLNRKLDAAREWLAPVCKAKLIAACAEETAGIGYQRFREFYDAKVKDHINKHQFESTTATALDHLETDQRAELVVRIGATQATAHKKEAGADKQAFRVLRYNHFQSDANRNIRVQPIQDDTVEARVPSLAVKELAHAASVRDVAAKLRHDYQALQTQLGGYDRPIVYNLLTSLHSKFYDAFTLGFWSPERKNRQRLSAARILKGSHLFNREQIEAGTLDSLFYVQNIPVNQHTNNLGYGSRDDATIEATVMADLALFHTLSQQSQYFSPRVREMLQDVYTHGQNLYVNFLRSGEMGNTYFKDSAQGKEFMQLCIRFKQWGTWALQDMPSPDTDNATMQELAARALLKITITDAHWNKQYGMLTQALSVFLETASMSGCKSAVERYKAVANRSELTRSLRARVAPLSMEEEELKNALRAFVADANANPAELQRALDVAYNQHTLQGVADAIALEDAGAGSKIKASRNTANPGHIREIDTNVAEPAHVSYLASKKVGEMQPHKGDHAEQIKREAEAYFHRHEPSRVAPAV